VETQFVDPIDAAAIYPQDNPMPKINVYLPDELAAAVRDAQLPVSAICQSALERAVRDVSSARATDGPPTDDRPAPRLFGRFTPRARQAVVLAEERAREIPHSHVGTEHVLLGVLDEGGNLALRVLESLDVEVADVRAELLASMPSPTHAVERHIPFSPVAKKALEKVTKEALLLAHNYIGCEHLLLGLLATEEGLASQVLRRMGLELNTTRRAVQSTLIGMALTQKLPQPPPDSGDTLEQILRRLDGIERRLAS
jgi:Clp amino terminal domain, pathogenicity island component